MTAVDYAGIQNKKQELVRKALRGGVFVAPIASTALTNTNLFDATTGGLQVIKSLGYRDQGWVSTSGSAYSRKVTTTVIPGWGTNDPLRTDITADVTTMKCDFLETNAQTISLFTGIDVSAITPATNGTIQLNMSTASTTKFYRVLTIGVDQGDSGEIIVARFLPRAQVTDYTDQVYANDKDPLVWGVQFTAYQDSTLGFAQAMLFGGEGWQPISQDMGFSRVVTCTTAVSTALVATTGTFNALDVGATIIGGTFPPGTTIATFTDATHVVTSAAATAIATAVPITITP